MIQRSIGDVKLNSAIADELIPNITGDGYRGDNSWVATMRALLPSRIPEGTQVRLKVTQRETPSKKSRAARMEYYLNGVDTETPYTITILDVTKTTEELSKVADAFKHVGIPGHDLAENVYNRCLSFDPPKYVMAYVNQETFNSVIVASPMNFQLWHTLQGFMRKVMFKGLFDAVPCTEEENQLLWALGSKQSGYDDYIRLIDVFAQKYDFRSIEIRRAVAEMATRARQARIREMEDCVSVYDRNIEQWRERIFEAVAERNEAAATLAGLKFMESEDTTAKTLTDFFLVNTRLHFTETSGNSMTYWVKTYLSYWDDRQAATFVASHNGYLYNGRGSTGASVELFERLLKDIFIDRKVRIKMCAAYTLNIGSNNVGITIAREARRPEELKDYLKNPHSMHYSCWGDHINNVTEAINRSDYVGAISATIAATAQLTLNDMSTGKFSEWLGNSEEACIELPDGTCMTCAEYLKKLEEEV